MWIKTYQKIAPNLRREDVWQIWCDVNNWPRWHGDLDYCCMEGTFEVGNHFMLKPKNASAVKIVLTEIQEGHSFTDCATFFGAKMFDTHTIQETTQGLCLTSTLKVTGPLAWIWIKLVAQHVAQCVPSEMEALIKRAGAKRNR